LVSSMTDIDLVPFEPPDRPTFRAAFRNFIESYPRALYEDRGLLRYRTRFLDSVLVSEPELIHDILVTRAHLFRRDDLARQLLSPMLGTTSMFMAEGAEWKWQRHAVAPAFRHDKLLALVPGFSAMAARQADRWRGPPGGLPINVAEAMAQTTFEIIANAVLGAAPLDAQKIGDALTIDLASVPWRFILASFHAPSWIPYPGRWRAARARDRIYRAAAHVVAQRRQVPSTRSDLLDLLLQARDDETGRIMGDEELVRNLVTFLLAGHETTAVALTWALWLLAKYPNVQDKVAAEVESVIGSNTVEARHVECLTFTRQVLQEAMRLYPPAPAISRQPLVPLVLGGEQLTPATQVTITIYPLHRNRRFWKHPNSFDPDRFRVETTKASARALP
jgi:cytochrome P450